VHDQPTRGFRNDKIEKGKAEGACGGDNVVETLPRPVIIFTNILKASFLPPFFNYILYIASLY
jgi:hypothetical protein